MRGVNLRKLEGRGGEGRGGGGERVAFEKLIRSSDDRCFESGRTTGARIILTGFQFYFDFQTHPVLYHRERYSIFPEIFQYISLLSTRSGSFHLPNVRPKDERFFDGRGFGNAARLTPLYLGDGFDEFTGLSSWKSSYERSSSPRLFHGRYPALKFPRRISHRSN